MDSTWTSVGSGDDEDRPLLSIIIPAYNHERYITKCLDSVLAIDYPAKEIVLIDDGSTDGTAEIVENWAEAHRAEIHLVVTSRPNRGVTATLNELLRGASGEYVLPLASDDYLLPGGPSALVDALEADARYVAVFGDARVVDAEGAVLHESALFGLRHADPHRLATRLGHELITNWAVAGAVLAYRRRPVMVMGGYDETLRVEDWDFYLRLAAKDQIRFVKETVSCYRWHAANETHNRHSRNRKMADERRVSLKAARTFTGRDRWLLLLKAIYLTPPFSIVAGRGVFRAAAGFVKSHA